MKNPELGRKVLDHITEHPEEFDMGVYGEVAGCGTVGCLAGHALIQDGYEMDEDGIFFDHDGGVVIDEAGEAAFLLGLTDEELRGDSGANWLFSAAQGETEALARFRVVVEASEDAKAAAHA